MKKLGLLGVLAVLALTALWYMMRGSALPTADAGTVADLETAIVERRNVGATVLATGVVRPQVGAEVQVGSRVSGILERLRATVGEPVRGGQLLAELDPTEFQARLQQAEAALENARVEQEFARREFERAEPLLADGIIAQAEHDNAQRAFRAAAAQVRQSEANLESARIQLDYTRIRAPISGVVASVSTQVGETVAASFAAPTFVTIIDLDRLEVWAYVDETDIGRVAAGQAARFSVDTYPGTEFEGVVTAIRPMAEIQDNVVNYVTVIEISDSQGKTLRPEMTTTVNIVLEGQEQVLAIPNGAVRREDGAAYALVLVDGTAQRRSIETGFRGRSHTEITSGLEPGEVVLSGAVESEKP